MDLALNELGGFGRFQLITTIALTLTRNAGGYLFYTFALLTAEQAYLCQPDENSTMGACENTLICEELAAGHDIVYAPDTTNPDYFNNWYIQMGLMCLSPAVVGLWFTMARITEGNVGWFMVGKTEAFGRKNGVLLFLGVSLLAQTILIFCPWYWARMVGYIFWGVA